MLFAGKTIHRLCAQASIYILKEYVTIVECCVFKICVGSIFFPTNSIFWNQSIF